MNLKLSARTFFIETLRQLNVRDVTSTFVQAVGGDLHVGKFVYCVREFDRVFVIAVGKAAHSMAEGVLPTLRRALSADQRMTAIVVGPEAPVPVREDVEYFRGSHPFPDRTSMVAADRILPLLAEANQRTLVLFLISGGASAMVEKPLDSSMTEEDILHFYRGLVHSGLAIEKINTLRKHFSRVKGGRLAAQAGAAAQCTLLVSDVPDDKLHVIASGPTLADPSTMAECRSILREAGSALRLSSRVAKFFLHGVEETPKADHPAFIRSSWVAMLSSRDLAAGAKRLAEAEGFHVCIDNGCDDLDYRHAAEYLVTRLQELRRKYQRVCLISCGELSVPLSVAHGTGGRNQQFCLECSRLLAERGHSATVLSGGSDGIDGNSPAAGAVCDEATWTSAHALGLEPQSALDRFDSFPLFEALGDTVLTGLTGNNLRDLRLLLSVE